MLKNILKDESGQGMVEHGLIIALIAVVVIGAVVFPVIHCPTNLNSLAKR